MKVTDGTRAALDYVLSNSYCVRCDSTVGRGQMEGFCTLCWKQRKPLPNRVRVLLEGIRS